MKSFDITEFAGEFLCSVASLFVFVAESSGFFLYMEEEGDETDGSRKKQKSWEGVPGYKYRRQSCSFLLSCSSSLILYPAHHSHI